MLQIHKAARNSGFFVAQNCKCRLYTKNEIYRRGYTSYSDSFIQFVCMFYTIPAIYEIVQAVMLLGSTYLTRIVWHVFIVFIERSYAGTVYNTQGERPKVPHVLHHLIGELTSMAFKHHMTI